MVTSKEMQRLRSLAIPAALAALAVLTPFASHAASVPVTVCDQTIDKGTAYLTGDLDCSPDGILRLGHVTLELRGFTYTGAVQSLSGASCKIVGPGALVAANAERATVHAEGHLTLENIQITGGAACVYSPEALVEIVGSTLSGCQTGAITFSDNARLFLNDSTVTGNGDGLYASRITVRSSEISGNTGTGLRALTASVRDSVIEGNGTAGIEARRRLKLLRSQVVNNGIFGVAREPFFLNDEQCLPGGGELAVHVRKDSTVTGNGTSPDCGTATACADISACWIKLSQSTCDHSYVPGSGIPGTSHGVCTND